MNTAYKIALNACSLPLTLSATLLPALIGKAQNPPPPEAGSGRVEREVVKHPLDAKKPPLPYPVMAQHQITLQRISPLRKTQVQQQSPLLLLK